MKQGESLRHLVVQLVENGKAYLQAEIVVLKRAASAWGDAAKIGGALIVVAIVLMQAAVTVMVAALGMALAAWLGTAGGLAVGALIVLLIAGGLVALAIARFNKVPR